MPLKPVLDSLEGVPEALHSEYVEREGKYHLSVEGMVPKSRVDEFRERNIAAGRELDELRERYDGIDPEEARTLLDRARKERDRKLIDAGKVDELVTERIAPMKANFESQLTALTESNRSLTSQLEGVRIDGAIRDAATKAGARPEAIEDFLYRGRQIFRLQDGQAVPMDGDKIIYGKNGGPMEITEWVTGLTERAPHLFAASTGGGARPDRGPARPAGTISRDDANGFLANLDKIAKGEVKVA